MITGLFLATSAWWLTEDRRVPDFDSGRHMVFAFEFHEALERGDLGVPFTYFTRYPPIVHLVGGLGAFISTSVDSFVLVQDLVFVPLLALGCYGVTRLYTHDDALALLAVIVTFGTPLVVSQFHAYMLDAPQAAVVAVTVWLVLASARFSNRRLALLAGVAAGLAMLVKQTSLLFGLGLVAVTLLRGGWRNRAGAAAFFGAAAILTVPWYAYHATELRGYAQGALGVGGLEDAPRALFPPRWTMKNAGWYFWNLVNNQLLLPFTILFLVGTTLAIVGYVRRRRRDDLTPELVIGGFVAYLALTFAVALHDPRYTLPAMVYIAPLAVGWLGLLREPLRLGASLIVVAIAAANYIGVSFGIGEPKRLALSGAPESMLHERQFTLYSPEGFVRGGPSRGGDVPTVMKAARRDGVRVMEFDPTAGTIDFNGAGLEAIGLSIGIVRPAKYDPASLTAADAFMFRRAVGPSDPPPCTTLNDGTGVYLVRGNPLIPFESYRLYCPTRTPKYYPARA